MTNDNNIQRKMDTTIDMLHRNTHSVTTVRWRYVLFLLLLLFGGMVRSTYGRLPLGFAASLVEEPTGRKNGAWAENNKKPINTRADGYSETWLRVLMTEALPSITSAKVRN